MQPKAVPLPKDDTWHKVVIDLSRFKSGEGRQALCIGYSPDAMAHPKISILPTEYAFAKFSLATSAPTDASTVEASAGPGWMARATAARVAVKSAGVPENLAILEQALADPEESVRLNTLEALAEFKVLGIEEKIASCMSTLRPRLSEAAAAALAFQDTPAGWGILQQALRVGPGTHTKVIAAGYIARRKDPASAGQISALQSASRDWHDRIATANALSVCGTSQALVFLRAFLDDPDPAVRTLVAGLIPPSDEVGLRRLMFVSVNDPSDAARSAACVKLLQSTTAEIKREGYRGANDDSWPVRVAVLDWIAAHPSTDDRMALRQAVTSPFGQVRAAALRAFAASPDAVTTEEIA